MAMDPLILLLGKLKREITRIVEKAGTPQDRLMLLDFGERCLAELRASIVEGK